jgi:hypothetical protein
VALTFSHSHSLFCIFLSASLLLLFLKLSDTYGRKAILPLGPASLVVCHALIFLRPESMWPLVLEQVATVPLVTSFFTTWRAALSDVLEGAAFARTQAKIGIAAGVGLLCGPFLSKMIMRRAHVKWCYAVSAVLAAFATARLAFFEETLPAAQRKPLLLHDMQPLSFIKIFRVGHHPTAAADTGTATNSNDNNNNNNNKWGKKKKKSNNNNNGSRGATLRRLMCITGTQTVTELRNVNQLFSVYMEKNLHWSWDQINNFTAAFGLSLIVSGAAVKKMIGAMGMRWFTTFSNASNVLSYLIFSGMGPFSFLMETPSARMWTGLLSAACGGRKRDAVEALIMKHGADAGLGRGFVSGSLMNFRAIVNMISPILFSRIYAFGLKRGRPELVFLFGALTSAAAECLWQSMTNQQLGLDENGAFEEKE